MSHLKLLFLFISTFLFSQLSVAQNDAPPDPVFKISFNNNSPKTGDVVEIIFKAKIPAGIHMYSTFNKCEIGPLKLIFNFTQNSSFCLVGEPFSVGDKKIVDDIFKCELGEFFNQAEVHQKIKILSNSVLIKGNIEGQWCNETQCFNFGGLIPLPFSANLKATGNPTKCDQKTEELETPIVVESIDTMVKIENTVTSDSNKVFVDSSCKNCSYRLSNFEDKSKCINKTFNGEKSETDKESNWGLFLLAFLSGLAGLLTPCVFPMIPMTVSFFLKDKKSKRKAKGDKGKREERDREWKQTEQSERR